LIKIGENRPQGKKPEFKDERLAENKTSNRKALQKLVILYHPDRIDKEKHGVEYFVLCEEIDKILSKLYTIEKDISD
jgi:curved DNA-binding protein CbpA